MLPTQSAFNKLIMMGKVNNEHPWAQMQQCPALPCPALPCPAVPRLACLCGSLACGVLPEAQMMKWRVLCEKSQVCFKQWEQAHTTGHHVCLARHTP